MCSDDTGFDQGPESTDPAETSTESSSAAPASSSEDVTKSGGWARRKFLTAAALGTAAAAFLTKSEGGSVLSGLRLGASPALAAVTCRAGDIEVTGGTAINEPCVCTGKFTPTFEFFVSNQNSANRTCITLILGSPASTNDSDCSVLNGTRLLLKVADGPNAGLSFLSGFSNNVRMIGTPVDSSGNEIQIDCNFTQCCFTDSIVAFKTANNQQVTTCAAPLNIGDFASAQCRKLTICLTGFGITADCADGSCATRSLTSGCCSVSCGQSLNVKITAVGGTAPACNTPLSLSVKRPGSSTYTAITLNASGCYVDSSPVQGTYTFRATDCNGCFREDTLAVCVQSLAALQVSASAPTCSGSVTLTVTNASAYPAGTTFTWTVGGTTIATGATATVTLQPGTTTITATASNGNTACDQTANVNVTVPPPLSIGAPVQADNLCSGIVTFNPGTASGGVGPYSYEFAIDGGAFAAGSTYVYHPTLVSGGLDTSCHSLVVRVTDANGCTATSPATTFSQCVSTSTGCTVA